MDDGDYLGGSFNRITGCFSLFTLSPTPGNAQLVRLR